MKVRTPHMVSAAVILGFIFAAPVAGVGGETNKSSFQKESEAGLKMDGDRGAPGINSGGQVIKPSEGEQDGRPGTIFGGLASGLPQDEALQYVLCAGHDERYDTPARTSSFKKR
jgi:hypothetical protein